MTSSAYRAAGYSEAQIQSMMEQNQSELEQLYYSALQSAAQNVSSVQANIESIQSQLDALSTGANDYYIYAPTSGVIHMDTPLQRGHGALGRVGAGHRRQRERGL